MIYLIFIGIALMRALQVNCKKRASDLLGDKMTYLHYGAYYQIASALFSAILLCFIGWESFDSITIITALVSGLLLSIELFASLQAIKNCTVVLVTMFSMGGLLIPCIVGIFFFNEPMSVFQWLGLALFMVSILFLISGSKSAYKQFSFTSLIMLIITFLTNGGVMVAQKVFALYSPAKNIALFSVLSFGVNGIILYLTMFLFAMKKSNTIKPLSKKLFLHGALLAFALFGINLLVTFAAKITPSVILFTVSSIISIIITCLVGMIFFKEKLTIKNIVGILLGLISILIINLF